MACSSSSSGQYGGMNKETFYAVAERVSPFIGEIFNPKISEIGFGKLKMILPFKSSFIGNPTMPCLHGGVLATLIDHTGGFCAWTTLGTGERLHTVDLRVDYLRPAPCEDLIFDAVVIHKSKRFLRTDVICWDKDHKIQLAIGRCLYQSYRESDNMAEKRRHETRSQDVKPDVKPDSIFE